MYFFNLLKEFHIEFEVSLDSGIVLRRFFVSQTSVKDIIKSRLDLRVLRGVIDVGAAPFGDYGFCGFALRREPGEIYDGRDRGSGLSAGIKYERGGGEYQCRKRLTH